MKQFILAYMGAGPKPKGDLDRIRTQRGVSLLNDTTSDSSVLVEGDRTAIETLLDGLPNWRVFENRQHKLVTGVRFGAKRKHAASK